MDKTKQYIIKDETGYKDFKEYFLEEKPEFKIKGNFITTEEFEVEVTKDFSHLLQEINPKKDLAPLIYGKDTEEEIVSIEIKDDEVWLYKTGNRLEKRELKLWILASKKLSSKWTRLSGNQTYKYVRYFDNVEDFQKIKQKMYRKQYDFFTMNNIVENQMVLHGFTKFKGLKVEDVSRLGFDIEADGLLETKDSEVYTISNTFRSHTGEVKKTFREDDYKSQGAMIVDWCKWVREINPDVMVAHNGFGYDLRYLKHVAKLQKVKLKLGRDGSEAKFPSYKKKYRVDGAQTWDYNNCNIFGRSIVDTMFLAVKYDFARQFPSWGLKSIIEHLGMVEEGRQFYDAAKIKDNWSDLEEREKIVKYCEDDGDDCLNLYELMVPSYFYMCQSIPKPLQVMLQGASGSWLNAIFVRANLQRGVSIPKATKTNPFEGAISYGVPGVYSNCFKQDVASLYPSIMLHYKIFDERKDPEGIFTDVVEFFTNQRLENKRLANETGDKYYRDLEQSQKVAINSLYGFLGASGLNFNSPENAALVTEKGREILNTAIFWSTGEGIDYWKDRVENPDFDGAENSGDYNLAGCDTDSILIYKKDQSFWTPKEREKFLVDMNEIYPDLIFWEDDGFYERVVVVKAKNYVLKEEGKTKLKFKGSSFKSSTKENALSEMQASIVEDLIEKRDWYPTYEKYLAEIADIKDIARWSTKKSVTETLLEANDTNKKNVLKALEGTVYRVGDKVHLFKVQNGYKQKIVKGEPVILKKTGLPKMEENIEYRRVETFDGDYYIPHYLKRVYDTLKILAPVLDIKRSPRYDIKRGAKIYMEEYLDEGN